MEAGRSTYGTLQWTTIESITLKLLITSHHGSRVKKRFSASLSASPIRRHSTLCKLKLASFRWWRRAACPPLLRTFRRRCNDCPFFLLRKVLDSCDVTLSHLAHIKCLPRQNCSFDLFFLKAASLEGRHRKAQLGLKHAEDAATHICTARNFLWWTSACSHLLGEKLTTNYSYHATTAWQATNMSFACRQHMGLAWTDAESCSTILVASLALETSNPPGLVDFSGSVLPVQA